MWRVPRSYLGLLGLFRCLNPPLVQRKSGRIECLTSLPLAGIFWLARCNLLFNQQPIYPSQILATIMRSSKSFGDARIRSSLLVTPTARGVVVGGDWANPGSGFVKINVDASWCASDGLGFVGVVARDEEGRFLAACRFKEKGSNVAVMEAKAILHGCKLGLAHGWNLIVVESDSAESISCLRDGSKIGNWEAFPIITSCSRLGNGFQECRWSWVPRSPTR